MPTATEVHASFASAYQRRFSNEATALSGLASTYEATHAIALAIATSDTPATSGAELARALRRASAGTALPALRLDQPDAALQLAASGSDRRILGALGTLRWDAAGARAESALELWCLARENGRMNFRSSGSRVNVLDPPGPMPLGACALEGVRTATTAPAPQAEAGEAPETAPNVPPPAADAGAADDPNPAGTPSPSPEQARSVPCGPTTCDVGAGEYCCVSALRAPIADPLPQDFRCARDEDACAITLRCTSDAVCGEDAVCCGIGTSTACRPAAECVARVGTRLQCESATQCAEGQTCCAQLMPSLLGYAEITCRDDCSLAAGGLALCETDVDCVAAGVIGNCRPSRIVPNLRVCVAL